MDWTLYQKIFEVDGTLRDIYVLNTSITDWQKTLDWLRTSPYQLTFRGPHDEIALPERIETIFEARDDTGDHITSFLSVKIGSCILNCHFFWEKDIEFDLDPREISSVADVNQVFEFMEHLARTVEKPAILTPESVEEVALFCFDPLVGHIQYNPDKHDWLEKLLE